MTTAYGKADDAFSPSLALPLAEHAAAGPGFPKRVQKRSRISPLRLLVSTALAGGLLSAASAAPVLAQTASQITPSSFRPPIEKAVPEAGIVIPDSAGPQVPVGMESLSVTVGSLQVEGGRPELAAQTQALEASLQGRQATTAQIFAAARTLEAAYARAGYVLVRVILPPQTLTDGGAVRLIVLDGRIERIDASAVPAAVRGRVDAVLKPLVGQSGLTLAKLERRLLLAGDTPGTILRSTLRAGAAPGSSVLVVEARYKPVTGSLSADNTLSAPIGGSYAGLGLEANSPTGHGELVYLRAGGDLRPSGDDGFFASRPRIRSLSAGVILPLGSNGLSASLEATDARTTPRSAVGALALSSHFQRLSGRLRYPLIRWRAFGLNLEAGLDAKNEQVDAISPLTAVISRDVLRVARFGGDLFYAAPGGGVFTARLGGSLGIDGLGARAAPPKGSPDIPLSRLGAGPEFRKLEASLGFSQSLARHLAVDLRARGQTAFGEALPGSEQIGLAGLDTLSSFDAGFLQGDAGYGVRGEVRFPFASSFTLPFALPDFPAPQGAGLPAGQTTTGTVLVSPYVFAAVGQTWLYKPTALERASSRGTAYGAGVRFGAAARSLFSGLSGSLEYGRAEVSDVIAGQQPETDRVTATLSLAY